MISYSFLILISFLLFYIIHCLTTRKNLPPGPIRWPIIGNIIELWLIFKVQKYPHLTLAVLAKKYGDVMSLAFGMHDAVVISSYEIMSDLMFKDDMLGRYAFPFAIDRAFNLPWLGGLVWSDIWVWRDLRKFTTKTLRSFGYGKAPLDKIIREKMSILLAHTKSSVEKNDGIFHIDSLALTAFASSIIFKLVGDIDFSFEDKTFLQMLKHSTTEIKILNFTNIYNLFPPLRHWFPKWTHHDEHMLIYKELQNFMKGVINTVKAKRALRDIKDQGPTNYIESFSDEIDKLRDSDDPTVFTEKQHVLMLMDLLGGSEVMSPVLQWSLLYLSLNHNVQKKVRREIDYLWKEIEDENVSISELICRMPYTKATMFEVYRICNLTPLPPPRTAMRTFMYKGYKIQQGSLMIWNLHPVMTDKTYWGDPETFRPERFLNETETEVVNTERMVTFGFGKRICFGQTLAWNIMFTGIAYFLRTFELTVIQDKEPSPKNPYKALALAPRRFNLNAKLRNI